MTGAELDVLNIELTDDPVALGYAGKTDPEMAELLNTVGLSNEEISAGIINAQDMQKVVVGSEFLALSAIKQRGWLAIISAGDGQVDVDHAGIINQVAAIWNGSTTLTNLAALRKRSASRAEVKFGAGISISHTDIAEALGRR